MPLDEENNADGRRHKAQAVESANQRHTNKVVQAEREPMKWGRDTDLITRYGARVFVVADFLMFLLFIKNIGLS